MISVIMLTYNRKKYVWHMIEDILNQCYQDLEFIIVDNGSTDGTEAVLSKYAKKDNRIKIITVEKPKSIGAGRNIGIKASEGDFIAFVDDDDRVTFDFLDFLMSLILDNGADISMCGASEGDGETRQPQCVFNEKMVLTGEEALRLLLGRKYIRAGIPTKLYKREILLAYPFEEKYKNEDIHTQYKYLLAGKRVVIHGIDKYYITRHDSNVSGFTSNAKNWDAQTMQDYLTAFHDRTAFIKENAPDIYEFALYTEWSFMISMIEKIDRFQLKECTLLRDTMSAILKASKKQFLKMPEVKNFEKDWIDKYID